MPRWWPWILTAGGMLSAAAAGAADPEPYLTVRDVGLYAEAKLVATVPAGEVVAAEAHDWNAGLLRVRYRGQAGLAERRAFQSQADVLEAGRTARAAAEGRLKGLNQQAELAYLRLQELYRALLQVQHDNALAYKLRVGGIRVEGPNVTLGDTGVKSAYQDILPDRRAEKLLKDWRTELTQVNDKLAALDRTRLTEVRGIFRGEQDREYYGELFARWAAGGRRAPATVYQVTARQTRLYLQQNPVVTLTAGQFLYARPHPANRAVIVSTYEGRPVTGQAQDVGCWRDRQRAHLDRQLELEDRVRRLENDLKLLGFRVKLYIPLCTDLRYRSAQKAEYVLLPELTVRPGTDAPIEVDLPADQLLVYALKVRKGQELLDQWTKDVKQLEDELFAKTKDLAAAQKALADATREWQEAQAAYAAFVRQPAPVEAAP